MLVPQLTFRLVCLLPLVACAGTPNSGGRVFPLVAGVEPGLAIQRVDIDNRKSTAPALLFEVDCRALPYAKGEERDFCYQWGHWGVLQHERGFVVACACGEFGGFVLWYSRDGELLQTLIGGDVPQALLADGEGLLCVTGISHLSMSEGAIHSFRLVDDRWLPVGATKLAKEVESLDVEVDGSLVLKLAWDGGSFRYRAGALERLPSVSPPETPMQPNGASRGAGG